MGIEEAIRELTAAIQADTASRVRSNELLAEVGLPVIRGQRAVVGDILSAPPTPTVSSEDTLVVVPEPVKAKPAKTSKVVQGVTITGLPADPPAAPAAPAPAPVAAAPAGDAPVIDYAVVRKAIIAFHKVHGNDGLKALLAPYGATKGQELKPTDYQAVLDALAAAAAEVA